MKNFLMLKFILILNLSCLAGIKITSKNEITLESKSQTVGSVMYVDKEFLKLEESYGTNKISVIFDKKNEQFYMVDYSKKSYLLITKNDLIQQSKQRKEQIKKLESEIKKLPKEQKDYYNELLKKQKEALNPKNFNLKYTKGKKSTKIDKWNCNYYKATEKGNLIKELWTVSYEDIGLQESDFQVIKDFAKFNQIVANDLQKQFGFMSNSDKKEYDGYPIKQIIYLQNKKVGQSIVKNIESTKFDDEFFKIPKDFTKINSLNK